MIGRIHADIFKMLIVDSRHFVILSKFPGSTDAQTVCWSGKLIPAYQKVMNAESLIFC